MNDNSFVADGAVETRRERVVLDISFKKAPAMTFTFKLLQRRRAPSAWALRHHFTAASRDGRGHLAQCVGNLLRASAIRRALRGERKHPVQQLCDARQRRRRRFIWCERRFGPSCWHKPCGLAPIVNGRRELRLRTDRVGVLVQSQPQLATGMHMRAH